MTQGVWLATACQESLDHGAAMASACVASQTVVPSFLRFCVSGGGGSLENRLPTECEGVFPRGHPLGVWAVLAACAYRLASWRLKRWMLQTERCVQKCAPGLPKNDPEMFTRKLHFVKRGMGECRLSIEFELCMERCQ